MNERLLLLINGWAGNNHLLDDVMIFSASYLIFAVFLMVAACATYLLYKRQWIQLTYLFATLAVSFLLIQVAAHLYVDHRPFVDHHLTQLVAHAAGTSFPSDHTTATTAIAFGLLLFTRFKKIGLTVLACAILIGFARIFVGIHYPIDILGGLLTGLAGGGLVYLIKMVVDRNYKPNAIAVENQKK